MDEPKELQDGLRNLTAQLGTSRDKASYSFYDLPSIGANELYNAYRGSWLARKIVDIPAHDCVSKWRSWSAERKQITLLEKEEKRLGLRQKLRSAMCSARLLGGSAIYISVGDNAPEEPLNLDSIGIGDLKALTIIPMMRLAPGMVEDDITSENYNRPRNYSVSTAVSEGQIVVHPSRLVRFVGAEMTEDDPMVQQGWGDSVLMAMMTALKQADGTSANIASMMFEAKVNVIKIPNFMSSMMDPDYEKRIIERFSLAALSKSVNGDLLLDAEEDFSQKVIHFAALSDIMDKFYINVSGAADIPMTRLFQRSPAGMNSTGEGDLRNYYDSIRSHQELNLSPAMHYLDEVLIRSALGNRPEEIYTEWNSLWQPTVKDRSDIGKITAEMIKILKETELFPQETLSQAAANAMVESGAMPGLDAAIEEFGMELESEEGDTPEEPGGATSSSEAEQEQLDPGSEQEEAE